MRREKETEIREGVTLLGTRLGKHKRRMPCFFAIHSHTSY
jgi:hypothetical protein